MTPTPLEWTNLTSTQRTRLLTCPRRTVDVQAHVLNADLTVASDISTAVDPTQGDIQWDSTRVVHRDLDLTLSLDAELGWGTTLLQIHKVYTDPATGLSARRPRGVFCLTAPDKTLGRVQKRPSSPFFGQLIFPVTGQDRLYSLDRQVGYSYYVPAGTKVLSAIAQVFTDAGLPGTALIDQTRSDAVVPEDMVWLLVPSDSSTATDSTSDPSDVTSAGQDPALTSTDSSSDTVTWLTVVNALIQLVAYRAVWCDSNGYYRVGPYVSPANAAPTQTFDATAANGPIAMAGRVISRNVWAPPNQWIGQWQNMTDGSGNSISATPDNGGILYRYNQNTGPASYAARGLWWPVTVPINAADATSFAQRLDARVAADQRVITTFTYQTRQYPDAEHFDVFTLVDAGVDGGTAKVQAVNWQEPMNAGDTQWTWSTT